MDELEQETRLIAQTNHRSANIVRSQMIRDEDLIFACRRGESGAWSMLVDRYQRLIYTIPRRAGLDEDQAADVFQCTFARLLENLDRIRRPDRLQAWLVTTARRETLRILRESNTKHLLADTEDPENAFTREDLPDDTPLPAEILEELEDQHLIHMSMLKMDDRCRRLLTLLYYRPVPPAYAEVAEILGMPEGSLGPTRARCLAKLRSLLEESGF